MVAVRLAFSEIRHGWKHFSVFVACLTLGIAIMASIGSLGDIVQHALESEAKSLLGGDIEVQIRGIEATPEQHTFLKQYGQLSYAATLRSMLYHGDDATLVELKGVDDAYPLVGDLLWHEPFTRQQIFEKNGVIVDAILLSQLGLKLGDTIRIGKSTYRIAATIKKEPDRTVQLFSFGPRVMLTHEALKQSGLINPFSLIAHRYRILTPQGSVVNDAFEDKLEKALEETFPSISWRVHTGTDGNRTVERFTDQLLSFLTLSGLATFLIAGIGIGSSARAYLEKKLTTIAILKTLGATTHTVLWVYIMVIGLLVLGSGVIGTAVAISAIQILLPLITPMLPVLEGNIQITPLPFLLAIWYGLLIAYLFSTPALLSALKIRPSLLFRSKMGILLFSTDKLSFTVLAVLNALLIGTLILTSRSIGFILVTIGIVIVTFILFGLCTLFVRHLARRMTARKPWLKLALSNLHRPGSTTGTVIFAIGISLTVLIALNLTEANFQVRIQTILQEEAPSLFMLDIQPHQKEGFTALLEHYASKDDIMLLPMIRGKISAINGTPVKEADVDDNVRWAIRGDRGLSYSASPPPNADFILGKWWSEDYTGPPLLSVDKRFIKGMNLEIGSTITLSILGENITATVHNARDIDYTSFQINFAMMLSPGAIAHFPRTYLSTIYLGKHLEKEAELVRTISKDFPGVTIIRTKEVVTVIRDMIGHIATALRITISISLFAGILVLVSALSATIEQRMYDTAMLKVLGARQRDILKSCTAEWLLLALVTSIIAAIIGTLSAWLINTHFRSQTFLLMPDITCATILACILVVWITGYIGNRRIFALRPFSLLRNE